MSTSLTQRANAAMPGGVNSPVRAFRSVGGDPIFARRGQGPYLETEEGRRLIDFCCSFGPLILGHAHPDVVRAVQETIANGSSFAVTTRAEIEMAELIKEAIPSIERLRLVSSGTEACMTAIRLARGATGRPKIIKLSGCYHGHADCLLVQAGSGVAGIASASSAGVPEPCACQMLVAPYNDLPAAQALFRQHGADIAAVILEPVAANMGLVPPEAGYLEGLAAAAREVGALVIFDEVITGFRFCFGGYQNLCGITPDLTVLGKVIGGGLPVGAIGGRADLMEQLAPLGPVYQAGTLSGNPASVAAGLATLRCLKKNPPYDLLAERAGAFVPRLREMAEAQRGGSVQIPQMGSLFSFFFRSEPVHSFADVMACDPEPFKRLFHALLANGVYLPPSPFEVSFLSTAHEPTVLEKALAAFEKSLTSLHEG